MPIRRLGPSFLLATALSLGLAACGHTTSPSSPAAHDLQTQGLILPPPPTLDLSPYLMVEGISQAYNGDWVVFGHTYSRISTSTVNKLQVYVSGKLVGSTSAAECVPQGITCMYYKNPVGTTGGSWFAQYVSPAFWNPPVLARSYTLTVKAYDALGYVKTVTKTASGGVLY